jgi:hypothetical protein
VPDFEPEIGTEALDALGLSPSLDVIKDILDGKTKWAEFIKAHHGMQDVMRALKITWKYHPANDGKDPKYPRCDIDNVQEMRQDLMHISAMGVHMAVKAAGFETASDGYDAERKLAVASAWRELRKQQHAGKRGHMTVAAMEQEADLLAIDRYRLKNESKIAGSILSWVRSSLRSHAETLEVLIRSHLRENAADARLH